MLTIHEKEALVLEQERKFADAVGKAIIERPKLSTWMILIPVIFVHYFYRLNRYAEGRKQFVKDFIKTRQRTLEEAALALESGRKPDVNKLVRMSSIPGETAKDYIAWLKVLLDHYRDLLSAEGDSFDQLVRSVYKNKGNYLFFINSLNEVEKRFDAALKPHLRESISEVNSIVDSIEKCCTNLRREQATSIFG